MFLINFKTWSNYNQNIKWFYYLKNILDDFYYLNDITTMFKQIEY